MFRMTKEDFDALCLAIINAVGEEEFKPENFIKTDLTPTREDLTGNTHHCKKRRMFYANCATTGGYINGETKLAITLRLMAGGSFLDIAALYCCGYTYTNEIFHATIAKWICNDEVIKFEGLDYLENIPFMLENAKAFSSTGCHQGIFSGVIGSLDGWLVKIRRPRKSDMVGDIASFYCRKGFYAVNVQAIVNKNKLVLWRSIKCRGAEHDSNAFKKSELYKKLLQKASDLRDLGLYFVGDSAYSIRSFLQVPYDNAVPQSAEDCFNYHLSTCRIWVECAFGEIDMRWGILWRPLQFGLEKNIKVIDAALRLHNFIILRRESEDQTGEYEGYAQESLEFLRDNPFEQVGVFNASNNLDEWGRLPRIEERNKSIGRDTRNHLKETLKLNGFKRPALSTGSEWYRDRFNRVFNNLENP
jgi:hypothetical protein